MKKKFIQDNTFGTFVEFIYDCNEEEFLNFINKNNGENYTPIGAVGKCILFSTMEEQETFIWIRYTDDYGTLAHEILHLIRFWLQGIFGIDLTIGTEEIYTKLLSFYFAECMKCLTKKTKRKSKKV